MSDPDAFNKKLGALMCSIVVPSEEGLGKGKSALSPFVTLYALVQCTKDLFEISCAHHQCLAIAVNNFPIFCSNRKGCRVLYSSCYVRYMNSTLFSSLLILTKQDLQILQKSAFILN